MKLIVHQPFPQVHPHFKNLFELSCTDFKHMFNHAHLKIQRYFLLGWSKLTKAL